MPKYEVFVAVTGAEHYEVEADNEKEAIEKAIKAEGEHIGTEVNPIENGDHEVHLIE